MNTDTSIFDRLRDLVRDCGPNPDKNDLAIVLILACIDEGVNTRVRIVGVLKRLKLNEAHVAITLNKSAGNNAEYPQWRCVDGVYCSHD